jgi:CRISPR/Cas system-associated protein Cas5 (RAMP superfamily)
LVLRNGGVDALEQIDGGWESNALNQTLFFETIKNETFYKKKYTVYTRLGEKRTLVGVFDTEQEALQSCKRKK